MSEYSEQALEEGFRAMSNCHTHLKEGLKTTNLKEFKIDVTAGPFIEINIKTRDPCDALEISGRIIRTLREMDMEPKAKVLP